MAKCGPFHRLLADELRDSEFAVEYEAELLRLTKEEKMKLNKKFQEKRRQYTSLCGLIQMK